MKRIHIQSKIFTNFFIVSLFLIYLFPGTCIGEKILTIWSINPNTPFGNLTDKIATDFSHEHKEFHLESVHFANSFYKNKLRAAMESDQVSDIFHNWGESSLQSHVKNGKVLSLDSIEKDLNKSFLPISFNPVTFDGRIYGVPYGGLTGVFFWYRKDLFKKLI